MHSLTVRTLPDQYQPVSYLRKVESFTVNKVAIAMESMNHGRIVFFAYSDSSVEYRDRSDMSETFNDSNLERVWHLSQIGLSYSEDEPCNSPPSTQAHV